MRYIYVDEAGTSAKEPVTVVVGIVVKPDSDWRAVQEEIRAALRDVPDQHREGFVFHAKAIWGDKRYRKGWSMEDRFDLLCRYASIPIRFGLSIAVGKVRRDAGGQEVLDQFGLKFSLAQWHHMQAFSHCLVTADQYLRERTEHEFATVVAEDIPEMRANLKAAFEVASVLVVPPSLFGESIIPSGITMIKDGVQFAEKSEAPFLQIADACAFSLRRFFSEQPYGDKLVTAMGLQLIQQEWLGPASFHVFTRDPRLRDSVQGVDWTRNT